MNNTPCSYFTALSPRKGPLQSNQLFSPNQQKTMLIDDLVTNFTVFPVAGGTSLHAAILEESYQQTWSELQFKASTNLTSSPKTEENERPTLQMTISSREPQKLEHHIQTTSELNLTIEQQRNILQTLVDRNVVSNMQEDKCVQSPGSPQDQGCLKAALSSTIVQQIPQGSLANQDLPMTQPPKPRKQPNQASQKGTMQAQKEQQIKQSPATLLQVVSQVSRTVLSSCADADAKKTGRWNIDEHFRFIEALQLYGKEWKRVQQHVGTRSSTQARSHAQKFFVKLDKKGQRLDDFLAMIDLESVRQRMLEAGSDQDYEDPDNYDVGTSKKRLDEPPSVDTLLTSSTTKPSDQKQSPSQNEINEKFSKPAIRPEAVTPVVGSKRLMNERNQEKKELIGIDLGMNVKQERFSIGGGRLVSKSFHVTTLKRQKTEGFEKINSVANQFNSKLENHYQGTPNHDTSHAYKVLGGPTLLTNLESQNIAEVGHLKSQVPGSGLPQSANNREVHPWDQQSAPHLTSHTPRLKSRFMGSPLTHQMPKRSTSIGNIHLDSQDYLLGEASDVSQEPAEDYYLPGFPAYGKHQEAALIANPNYAQAQVLYTPFERGQSFQHFSTPVQSMLLANLAPNAQIVPPSLNVEFLTRNSFDVDDKVMEMTPQGYQNYHNRKLSEALGRGHSPSGDFVHFSEIRPRVHAASLVHLGNQDMEMPYNGLALEF